MRTIQSFVRRSGRLTKAQQTGLGDLWQYYGVNLPNDLPNGLLDLSAVFVKPQPVVLEIGFGSGDSLLQMAMAAPEQNFLGIEVYQAGIGRLINEAHKHDLHNLKIINADAVAVLSHHIPDASIDRLQLFFPDPWHKKKHHKRRLIQIKFLNLVARKLKAGAHFHLATDWQPYAEQMMQTLEQHPNFHNTAAAYHYIERPESRPLTKFERRGIALTHAVRDLRFSCDGLLKSDQQNPKIF